MNEINDIKIQLEIEQVETRRSRQHAFFAQKQENSALLIQKQYRRALAKKRVNKILQVKERERRKKEEEERAALVIERVYRGFCGRKLVKLRMKEVEEFKLFVQKVVRIQRAWRSYKSRLLAMIISIRRRKKKMEESARILQRMWRGYKGRKSFNVSFSFERGG